MTTLEAHVLSNPSMSDVRHLHILSSQLLMLKSSITPFQYLLHALRSQDDMKAAAAAKPDGSNGPPVSARDGSLKRKLIWTTLLAEHYQAGGFRVSRRQSREYPAIRDSPVPFSADLHAGHIKYLGDVIDHVDSVLSSLDLFGDLAENLVAFT